MESCVSLQCIGYLSATPYASDELLWKKTQKDEFSVCHWASSGTPHFIYVVRFIDMLGADLLRWALAAPAMPKHV